jgi:methionyl aminopeptidase
VVRQYVGHGIGRSFHEGPQVPHFRSTGDNLRLREGMTFTIEPMINLGTWRARVLDDGWTAVTVDGKLSAQFEHTIAVTSDGCEVLTARPGVLVNSEDVTG